MDQVSFAFGLIVLLFVLLGFGLWIALALAAIGLVAIVATGKLAGATLATALWGSSNGWDLTALPMFIWMGEILYRSRLSEDMFEGLAPWMQWLPGRLFHVNVLGCTIFAAVSGSSAATCATVGKIALPELLKRGYDERLAIGSLAGAGTLGLLIPPSLIMIVYGAATDQSIARLFIAGVIPGLMVAGMMMLYVMAWASLNRRRMPPPEPATSFANRLQATRRLIPVVLLIAGVIGSIYGGLASATEAAVVGVLLSLALARWQGTLTRASFREALLGATRTSCMIAFILAGAGFLTVAMGLTGIPRALALWVGSFNLSQGQLILVLTVLYVILGCFLDGISMVVLTTAVVMPLIEAARIDLIWFGIFIVLVVEMAAVTPPVGFNLFVLQGMTGRNIFAIGAYAFPFFVILSLAALLLYVFPGLALWLPATMLEAG